MKRLAVLLLSLCLLSGCVNLPQTPAQKQYSATFLELFDTVTTVVGRAESKEAFEKTAYAIREELQIYHQLFDIYHDYPGMNNLKTVNDRAGIAPVQVDKRIIAMLLDCKAYYTATGGRVNVAMGSVLKLWHEAREDGINDPANAYLPDKNALEEAARHTDMEKIPQGSDTRHFLTEIPRLFRYDDVPQRGIFLLYGNGDNQCSCRHCHIGYGRCRPLEAFVHPDLYDSRGLLYAHLLQHSHHHIRVEASACLGI